MLRLTHKRSSASHNFEALTSTTKSLVVHTKQIDTQFQEQNQILHSVDDGIRTLSSTQQLQNSEILSQMALISLQLGTLMQVIKSINDHIITSTFANRHLLDF